MSRCTQIFLITIKGENKDLEQFKEYYEKSKPLLIHNGNQSTFSYNSNHSKVWVDQPNHFSFFIIKYRRTNKSSSYSIEKLAQKFPELEFHHVFIIHHDTLKDAKLSSEGYEIYKNGKLHDSYQIARNAIDWCNIVYNGVPDTLHENFIKMKSIKHLQKEQGLNFDSFNTIPQLGYFDKPLAVFNSIMDEEDIFNDHFDEFSIMIQNQLKTGLVMGAKENKYTTVSADLSLLNFALTPYIIKKIPELNCIKQNMTLEMDIVVEKITNKELDPEVVLLRYYQDAKYYAIFKILEMHNYSKYDEIYKLIDLVNSTDRFLNDNEPF